ncbi:hypothetical protein PanWU01x14_289690 [Parasponia andersonii]|uniref:Uncharacterized protein n=1 Tax=Parasponia andersonii TaxID=3476 RepID=A0A2P5AY63_PARAD|nr:hypothetical protein PanWU01x14_289690 [Parasponia andersonii]
MLFNSIIRPPTKKKKNKIKQQYMNQTQIDPRVITIMKLLSLKTTQIVFLSINIYVYYMTYEVDVIPNTSTTWTAYKPHEMVQPCQETKIDKLNQVRPKLTTKNKNCSTSMLFVGLK